MNEEKQIDYRKFDNAWNLNATVRQDGTIASANSDRITAATALIIRDELREMKSRLWVHDSILRELRGLRRDLKAKRSPRRFCRKCERLIAKGHKYVNVKGGRQHRFCARPDSYK